MKEEVFSTKCWKCKEHALTRAKIPYTIPFRYSETLYVLDIPNLLVPRCAKCGTIVFDHDANMRIDNAIRDRLGLLQPHEIQQILDKNGLEFVAAKIGESPNYLVSCANGDKFTFREVDNSLKQFKEHNGK